MGKHTRRPTQLGEYDVGYCRTPEHTRFPHQVRKPRPPKPVRHVATRQFMREFFTALETEISITRNGKKIRLPAAQIIQEQLVAKAVKGEPWALKRVTELQLALIREYEAELAQYEQAITEIEAIDKRNPINKEAREILEELRRRTNDPRELFDNGEGSPRRRR